MRLHELTERELIELDVARNEAGWNRYGSSHRDRYNLLDVYEELSDAEVILHRLVDRMQAQGYAYDAGWDASRRVLLTLLDAAKRELIEFDRLLPDDLCTDEAGGERLWWSAEARRSRQRGSGEV